ncbi:MAG: IclR family transcriptional regulator [Firmicutes bacterium]|nr:IclR family transcriptional regulator [Bacillota bacterium]
MLEALIRKQPQSLTELAQASGIAKSTAHRLLRTLKMRGFVHVGPDGRYRLGAKSAWLRGLPAVVQRRLDELRARTGETANLGMLAGREIEYVARSVSAHALRWGVDVGSRVPCHCTAMGKAVLAFRPDVRVEPRELVPYTPRTVTDPEELEAQLELVRRRGYALDDEEFILGVFCVAVPVRDQDGRVVGAVSVAGPSVRWDRAAAMRHLDAIKAAGRAISRALGHDAREEEGAAAGGVSQGIAPFKEERG